MRENRENIFAKQLRMKLALRMGKKGLHEAVAELFKPAAKYFPGSRELPYLAEELGLRIVEHDLDHELQPAITHGSGHATIHLGFTVTERGAPHWVLLNDSDGLKLV